MCHAELCAVSGEKLLSPLLILSQCIPRSQEEDCLNQHEHWIDPAELALGFHRNSVADPVDCSGDEHVCVELVVPVVNLDEQVVGVDFARQLGEVQFWSPQAGRRMNQIDTGPADGGDGHSHGQ